MKKCLPVGAILGIPRLRATTGLRSVGNDIALCDLQRRRARTGSGPVHLAFCELRTRDQIRGGAGDYETASG